MIIKGGGRYRARLASDASDISRALALRSRVFRSGVDDADRFDTYYRHVLVEDTWARSTVCCFRWAQVTAGDGLQNCYTAQFYDLSGLENSPAPMLELGRFVVDPRKSDPAIIRVAWNALSQIVDKTASAFLFGCSSFPGIRVEPYREPFALLRERHLAPDRWLPKEKSRSVFNFIKAELPHTPDLRSALRAMPPLLRSYLALGGGVSDHAVIDRELGTLHVFTGLEIDAIPPKRARLLRAPVV